jgi:hypothetical protein
MPVKKYIKGLPIILIIGVSLLNNNLFGYPGLSAYFGFILLTCLLFLFAAGRQKHIKIPLPYYIFFALAVYFFLQGAIHQNINMTCCYWVACGLFTLLLLLYGFDAEDTFYFFKPISFLGAIEGLIVVCQWLGLSPSANAFFPCTGTWQNPNVTAAFLSFCTYAAIQVNNARQNRKATDYFFIALIILAICLLQCRTAIIITTLFAADWALRNKHIERILPTKFTRYLVGILFIVGLAAILAFACKEKSTSGRLTVWRNTIRLVEQAPLAGFGSGMFAKEYNLFVSRNNLPSNDCVYMPYNDFLEIYIEGGFTALLLWCGFIISILYYRYRKGYSLSPVIGFLILQGISFGFQAVPAFITFLVLSFLPDGIANNRNCGRSTKEFSIQLTMPVRLVVLIGIILLSAYQLVYANGLYRIQQISTEKETSIEAYENINQLVYKNELYAGKYGWHLLQGKKYDLALLQYKTALQSCSNPNLWLQTGNCYACLKQYDSSEYYYRLAETLQPQRLMPKASLLGLYQECGDTLLARKKALEIVNMPIKVENEESLRIKAYANNFLRNCAQGK